PVLIHGAPRSATIGVHESPGLRGVSQVPGDLYRQGVRIDGHVSLVDEEVGVALEPLAFEIREPDPVIFLLLAVLVVEVPHHSPPASSNERNYRRNPWVGGMQRLTRVHVRKHECALLRKLEQGWKVKLAVMS